MTAKEKKQFKQTVALLKCKNLYEPSDDILIDELIFMQFIIAQSKKKLPIMVLWLMLGLIRVNLQYNQANLAVSIYRDALKSLITICTKLGITPQERSKLKLIERSLGFEINKFLNEN
jgi:phage terminase small subunit